MKTKTKEWFKDIVLAFAGLFIIFCFGFAKGFFELNTTVLNYCVAFGIWGVLLTFRKRAAMIYAVVNLNIIMVLITAFEMRREKKKNDQTD